MEELCKIQLSEDLRFPRGGYGFSLSSPFSQLAVSLSQYLGGHHPSSRRLQPVSCPSVQDRVSKRATAEFHLEKSSGCPHLAGAADRLPHQQWDLLRSQLRVTRGQGGVLRRKLTENWRSETGVQCTHLQCWWELEMRCLEKWGHGASITLSPACLEYVISCSAMSQLWLLHRVFFKRRQVWPLKKT